MTVQDLNQKAERLKELYKEEKKVKRCRSNAFRRIFGDSIFAKEYWDYYVYGAPYPQDEEINKLIREMNAGMRELGFSEIFIHSLSIKKYVDVYCVEYLPIKTDKYDELWFD